MVFGWDSTLECIFSPLWSPKYRRLPYHLNSLTNIFWLFSIVSSKLEVVRKNVQRVTLWTYYLIITIIDTLVDSIWAVISEGDNARINFLARENVTRSFIVISTKALGLFSLCKNKKRTKKMSLKSHWDQFGFRLKHSFIWYRLDYDILQFPSMRNKKNLLFFFLIKTINKKPLKKEIKFLLHKKRCKLNKLSWFMVMSTLP